MRKLKPAEKPQADTTLAVITDLFAPGESDFVEIPVSEGVSMKFKKFKRYGELDAFQKARKQWCKRAVDGVIAEAKGIDGLTLAEAEAIYTITQLAVEPKIELTAENARRIVETPYFGKFVVGWLENTGFAAAESQFISAITEGKA